MCSPRGIASEHLARGSTAMNPPRMDHHGWTTTDGPLQCRWIVPLRSTLMLRDAGSTYCSQSSVELALCSARADSRAIPAAVGFEFVTDSMNMSSATLSPNASGSNLVHRLRCAIQLRSDAPIRPPVERPTRERSVLRPLSRRSPPRRRRGTLLCWQPGSLCARMRGASVRDCHSARNAACAAANLASGTLNGEHDT